MASNIVIKQKNIKGKKILTKRSESVYSLIDKPYYVDAVRYKVEWRKFLPYHLIKNFFTVFLWDRLYDPHQSYLKKQDTKINKKKV